VRRTPADDVVGDEVWLSGEDGENESIVKVHSLNEHPREHGCVCVLHSADQHLTDYRLQHATSSTSSLITATVQHAITGGMHGSHDGDPQILGWIGHNVFAPVLK